MKALLFQNMPYVGRHGGAIRSNRIMLEQLAAREFRCLAVAPLAADPADMTALLDRYGAGQRRDAGDAIEYELNGVRCFAARTGARLVPVAFRVIAEQRPDWLLVPSDDPGGLALGAALAASPDRVVYLVHTLQQLPFGPRAFYPSPARTELVRRAAGVVAVSRAAQQHVARWAGITAELIYPQVYGSGPFPQHRGASVTIVNPCEYKGIGIFLGLADAYPRVSFLAVASWGTTAADRRELARRSNVETIEAVDDIDRVLARTRVLVMPSLWDETFGYTAVEAMLRGIPVLASAVGGLREATLGVPQLLPIRAIERYDTRTDPARPIPAVPRQELTPWIRALDRLLNDESSRAELGRRCRHAATEFVRGLDEGALAGYLERLKPAGSHRVPVTDPAPPSSGSPNPGSPNPGPPSPAPTSPRE